MTRTNETKTLLLALLSLPACTTGISEARPSTHEPLTEVRLETVAERPMPRTLTLTGTLVANRESDVAADATGKVVETSIERGDIVAAGAPLARLDARSAALSAVEARAQAASAVAQRELARTECARADTLLAARAIHRAEYDRMHAQCTVNELSSSAAQARERLAGVALRDATIRAPFAGMIAERFITIGEFVRPDSRVATLVEVDPLRLELTVPEADLTAVRPDQALSFEVAAYPGERFAGTVRFIGPALRRASRDLVVEAVIPNPDHRLRPGLFAVAQVEIARVSMPVVPAAALREEGGRQRVFTVRERHLEERIVQLGPRHEGVVAVLSGLRAGDRIAAALDARIHDGLRVE